MTNNAAQVIIGQKFVNLTGKVGDDLSLALLITVTNTQKEVEKSGMQGASVIIRQVIVTGTFEIKATVIMDIMQIATLSSTTPEERSDT